MFLLKIQKCKTNKSRKSKKKEKAEEKAKARQESVEELEAKIEKLQAQLPQITTRETVVRVKPDVNIYLPSGSLDFSLKQEYKKTTLEFVSQYDLVHNNMGVGVDLMYNFKKIPIGLLLKDYVDFEAIFSNSQYLQRVQSMSPYAKYLLCKNTELKTALRFENTSTSSTGTMLILDKGRNIVGEIGIYNSDLDESRSIPRGGSRSLKIENSLKNLGSDYNYSQMELNIRNYFTIYKRQYFEYDLQASYPLSFDSKPLSAIYYAGGYKVMKGYNYREFSGNSIIYNSVKHNIPIAGIGYEKFLGIEYSIVTWNIFAEGVKIGGKEIFSGVQDAKYSVGSGLGYTLILFKKLPVKFEVSMAKAFEPRGPKMYLTVSTLYYTWSNK
ncbi:MAG: BamA/TamA family outer membrane protein [Elusimicrobia bacterium]|nr:BamA/TamA family outer membrane protein [Elusimicrobiota bacterium]